MKPIDGLISLAEGETLAMLAARLPRDHSVIVEIGSYTGYSSCFLAEAAPHAHVYCIDLWNLRLPEETNKRTRKKYKLSFNSTEAFELFLSRTAKHQNVTWIRGDSREIAKAWDRPIGLLFIDGAHEYDSVVADYRNWGSHVRRGGYIVMHDVHMGPPKRVLEEVIIPEGEFKDWQFNERLAYAVKI